VSQFEYLAVLISIVLGLGITQLLSGFGRWLEHRSGLRAYAPAIVWAAILLVLHVQTWWAMFALRDHPNWTFLQFSVVLLQPITLFLLATLVLPSPNAPDPELRSNYFAQRSWFFGLLVLLLAVSLLRDLVLTGSLPAPINLGFHIGFLIAALMGALVEHEGYHRVMAYVGSGLVAIYVLVLFAELG
jgi:hypothetical protein